MLLISILVIYLITAFILSIISTNPKEIICSEKETVYLITNGIHLDIVIENKYLNGDILNQLKRNHSSKYIAFGWGDRDFYLNTPNWSDLNLKTVINALFFESKTVMHVTNYSTIRNEFIKIDICKTQLEKLIKFIENSFDIGYYNELIEIKGEGYSNQDNFYEAIGNYNCIKTCNEWVNEALKTSEIKTSVWSPFDKGILYHIEKNME